MGASSMSRMGFFYSLLGQNGIKTFQIPPKTDCKPFKQLKKLVFTLSEEEDIQPYPIIRM